MFRHPMEAVILCGLTFIALYLSLGVAVVGFLVKQKKRRKVSGRISYQRLHTSKVRTLDRYL